MLSSQSPTHWSKDFVEHLRTVHFTLIALCIGLIILASFRSETEIQRAYDQAAEILKVINAWDSNLFEEAAQKVVRANLPWENWGGFVILRSSEGLDWEGLPPTGIQAIATVDHELESQYPGSQPDWVTPRLKYPSWTIKAEIPTDLLQNEPGSSNPKLLVKAPPNLSSFQHLWDSLLAEGWLIVPAAPEGCVIVNGERAGPSWNFDFQREVGLKPCRPVQPNARHRANAITFEFRKSDPRITELVAARQGVGKWDYEFSAIAGGEAVGHPIVIAFILPVSTVQRIKFDTQEALLGLAPGWVKERKRSFSDAFRELASVDGALADADISSAERLLAEEAKREVHVFEAMGLKIPADLAVRCGVLLVFGVQFYMWIHLYEFGNRLERDPGFDVAWIGVYTSKPAQILVFASLLLLPCLTVLVLSYRGTLMSGNRAIPWIAAVLANAISIALSALIFRALPKRA